MTVSPGVFLLGIQRAPLGLGTPVPWALKPWSQGLQKINTAVKNSDTAATTTHDLSLAEPATRPDRHRHMHTHTHTLAHVRTHTHTHIHTQPQTPLKGLSPLAPQPRQRLSSSADLRRSCSSASCSACSFQKNESIGANVCCAIFGWRPANLLLLMTRFALKLLHLRLLPNSATRSSVS